MSSASRRSLAAIAFSLVLTACGGGGEAAAPGPPDGRDLFNRSCAICHSADGSGGIGLNLIGVHDRLTDAEITTVIVGGRNNMPAWGGRLEADEIAAIVDHLRTFG